jgi:hypothetical protein
MTTRATFGDFAREASRQLDHRRGPFPPAGSRPDPAAVARQVREFSQSADRVLKVIDRYLGDIPASIGGPPSHQPHLPRSWAQARIGARAALRSARGYLARNASGVPDQPPAADPVTDGMDPAAVSLAAGRDLLHTHLDAGHSRPGRSEWAPVIGSAAVNRALLAEVAGWAEQIAARGTQLALTRVPPQTWLTGEQQNLNAACQSLQTLTSAVREAQRQEPLPADDIALLHAIPAGTPGPRLLPAGTETVAGLCQGTTRSAERIRHVTRSAAPAAWSPFMTAESLSQAATCATVISHHCQVLLTSLAERARQLGSHDFSRTLAASAVTAGHARAAWITAARAWYQIRTDARGAISPAAAETADLALWTGRLAYTSPGWTLDLGPAQATRPPEALAPEPADLGNVLAAVHQATETLTALAAADYTQIRDAAHAGRFLVPTRSLPEAFDNPHPFARAPAGRVNSLLAAYGDAGRASVQATADVSAIAAGVRAPSAVLTWAQAATHASSDRTDSRKGPDLAEMAAMQSPGGPSGPVGRTLHELGVTSRSLLARGAAIDQAAGQLILDATREADARHAGSGARDAGRLADTAEPIKHIASSRPLAPSLIRRPVPGHDAELQAER